MTAAALVAEDLTYRHPSGLGVFEVSLRVGRGETVGLMGPSGSGKTTLLRLLAGLRAPASGRVLALGASGRARGVVGYIPQQLGLVRNASAVENVLHGALARVPAWRALAGAFPADEVEAARSLLQRIGLADKADRPVATLSGGERQRVAVARALLQRPRVLLADEFTANLDVLAAGEVLDLLREATGRGVATVVALHSPELAREHADRVLFLREGRIVAEHPAREVTVELARRRMA